MHAAIKRIWHSGREHVTDWAAAGIIIALTGATPDHWVAGLFRGLHIPDGASHLWSANIDLRWVMIGLGLTLVVGDIAW